MICTWTAPAAATAGVCDRCGHSVIAHIGTPRCVICDMAEATAAMQAAARSFGQTLRTASDGVRDQPWPASA